MNKIIIPTTSYPTRELKPEDYILTEELEAAIKVAITLGVPLLVTGEPGTGKTRLAYRVAHDLHAQDERFNKEPLRFDTKTTSAAQDLFYTYDALRHFHDAGIAKASEKKTPNASAYITKQALGKAIDDTHKGKGSVVLIDEIDKAPRDFANDLLNEIENYEYKVKELPEELRIKKNPDQNIVTIMTSNSEKNLPEAFLRRVVFFHIEFPKKEDLRRIVRSQLKGDPQYTYMAFIEHFEEVRRLILRKKPATDELLKWLYILEMEEFLKKGSADFNNLTSDQLETLKSSYSVLAKTKEDMDTLIKSLNS